LIFKNNINKFFSKEITACKISPDATALVVTGSDGELAFFVIEQFDDDIQIASNCRPLANNPIEELIFLDSLWKTVVLSSDNGRRLAIFDCDNWQCMAKLRFESPNQVTRMELLAEPNMHFLFVADYDLSVRNFFKFFWNEGRFGLTFRKFRFYILVFFSFFIFMFLL